MSNVLKTPGLSLSHSLSLNHMMPLRPSQWTPNKARRLTQEWIPAALKPSECEVTGDTDSLEQEG